MRPKLIVEGRDLSQVINKYRYRVAYTRTLGKNGGTLLTGEEIIDVLRVRAVLTLSMNFLTDAEIEEALDLFTRDSVEVVFYDPRERSERSATFIPDMSQATLGIMSEEKTLWRDGVTLTLREK